MELFDNLMLGFSVAISPENLAYALLGCILGTLIGVLPGIGPVPTIAMLLPITYVLPPVAGLIMLAGIYYGAQYGGSTTAIPGPRRRPRWRSRQPRFGSAKTQRVGACGNL
jgi:putative tricarboxylic transport membrane protein